MTIAQTILTQLNYKSLHGALIVTGNRKCLTFPDSRESAIAELPNKNGYVNHINGLKWIPNTNIGRRLQIFVMYHPGRDTYTVYLYKNNTSRKATKTGVVGEIVKGKDGDYLVENVYCDQLIEVVDMLYTQYIEEFQDGFIKI